MIQSKNPGKTQKPKNPGRKNPKTQKPGFLGNGFLGSANPVIFRYVDPDNHQNKILNQFLEFFYFSAKNY